MIAGPPAVVQLTMWQQGDVVMSQLTDRLILAMKHSVSDIIMEFRLLTAPLCDVPEHYVKGVDSPLHSAPPSPVLAHSTGSNTFKRFFINVSPIYFLHSSVQVIVFSIENIAFFLRHTFTSHCPVDLSLAQHVMSFKL